MNIELKKIWIAVMLGKDFLMISFGVFQAITMLYGLLDFSWFKWTLYWICIFTFTIDLVLKSHKINT